MMNKILSMGPDGRPVLRLPGGKTEPFPMPCSRLNYVFLLVDCSSSMEGGRLLQAKEGGLSFAEKALAKNYAVGLIRFASGAEVLSEPSIDLVALKAQISGMQVSGSTNMTAAIELAVEKLAPQSGKCAIVIATDGAPDDEHTALGAAERAKGLNIDIITIGTDDADRRFLRRLASRADLSIEVSNKMLAGGMSSAARLLAT